MKTKKQIFVIIFKMVAILFLITISNSSFAGFPPIQWNGCRGGLTTPLPSASTDNASCIQQTTDGGYIVIGSTNSIDGDNAGNVAGFHILGGSNTDVWVLRFDSLGNILWQKCLGGTGTENASCLAQSFDSTYLVSASTNSPDGDIIVGGSTFHPNIVTPTNTDAWIVKIDKNGNMIWQKCYGGDGIEISNSIIQAKDSNYIFAGNMNSTNGDNAGNVASFHILGGSNSDYWIVKIDKNGNMIWQKCYGGSGVDQALSIKQTFSGGYAISGTTTSSNTGDIAPLVGYGQRDVWFIKISSTGILKFQKCFGGNGNDQGSCVIQTLDSGFVLANMARSFNNLTPPSDDLVIGGSTYNGNGQFNVWLVKLDSSGVLKYQKCYGGINGENLPWIVQSRDKGYIFETFTKSIISTIPVCNPSQHGSGSSDDIWIVKLMDPPPPLPIELISFKAKLMKDKVQLTWSTASEINNNYFSIEKSIDGYNYQEIGQVSGAGNSNEVLNYSFFDTSPSFGISYYRLSQTDYNGTKETFAPVPVTYYDEKNVSKIAIYNLMGQPLDVDINSLNSLASGIYLIISYDRDANILNRVKFFKQ